MNQPDTTNFIPPTVYRLLNRVKNVITTSTPVDKLSDNQLIDLITDQIKECGDKIGLPIIRQKNKFFIYEDGVPIPFPNRSLEKFLLLIGDHLGVKKDRLENMPFREGLFGACWRKLYEGE